MPTLDPCLTNDVNRLDISELLSKSVRPTARNKCCNAALVVYNTDLGLEEVSAETQEKFSNISNITTNIRYTHLMTIIHKCINITVIQ